MMEWQPIETWDRKDSWVILYQPAVPNRRGSGLSERVITPGNEGRRVTTHWMPLPDPPNPHTGDKQ